MNKYSIFQFRWIKATYLKFSVAVLSQVTAAIWIELRAGEERYLYYLYKIAKQCNKNPPREEDTE